MSQPGPGQGPGPEPAPGREPSHPPPPPPPRPPGPKSVLAPNWARKGILPAGLLRDTQAGESLGGATAPVGASSLRAVAAAPDTRPSGSRLGKFLLLGVLGRGGMGVVYHARDTDLNREVALKTLPDTELWDPQAVERLRREARIAATLEHPGIVPIHEVGTIDDTPYFAMAYVRGRTLDRALREGALPSLRERVLLLHATAEAVGHAHERRVVHRDLKPGNLILDDAGRVRVLDFGLARDLDRATRLTLPGQVFGTVAYMPPEQLGGDTDRVGPAADVYALGAILYELCTGRPVFEAPNVEEMLERCIAAEPEPPRRRDPRIPADLEAVCLAALRKRPEDRYPTARELAEDLERHLRGAGVHARPRGAAFDRVRTWATAGAEAVARRLREPAAQFAGAALLAAAAGAVAWFAWAEREAERRAEDARIRVATARAEVEAARANLRAVEAERDAARGQAKSAREEAGRVRTDAQAARDGQAKARENAAAPEVHAPAAPGGESSPETLAAELGRLRREKLTSLRSFARVVRDAATLVRRCGSPLGAAERDLLPPLRQAMKQLAELDPRSAEPRFHEGRVHRILGRFADAARCQKEALAKAPDFAPSLFEDALLVAREWRVRLSRVEDPTGNAAAETGAGKAARDAARTAARAELRGKLTVLEGLLPDDDQLVPARERQAALGSLRGMELGLAADGWDAARRELEAVLASDPLCEDAYEALFDAATRFAKGDAALDACRRATKADPGHVPHWLHLVRACLTLAVHDLNVGGEATPRLEEATAAAERARQLASERAEAWSARGEARLAFAESVQRGGGDPAARLAAAIDDFDAALERDAECVEALTGRGIARMRGAEGRAGRGEELQPVYAAAKADLERAIALGDARPGVHAWLLHAERKLGAASPR
ncbi:MAG: serine/threonine protein kinase [Planctomycetes bacterium]|nr:serine/threonine protein kinase [Planctomycetota bacterium]